MIEKLNWTQYKGWIENVIESKKDLYYRGQRDPSWKLQTTFHRFAADVGIDLPKYLSTVIPEIHHHVCAQYNEIFDMDDPNEFGSFLSLLQHHGFPTPLLDWTLSPYIATYFAFRDVNLKNPHGEHVKIFVFDYQAWQDSYQQPLDLKGLSPYVSVVRPHAKHNPRLIPQRGTYTVTNISDMEDHLLRAQPKGESKIFLHTALLPVKETVKIMRDLNLMGINEMTLFPGMDGICKTLKEQFFSPDVVGSSLPLEARLKERAMSNLQ